MEDGRSEMIEGDGEKSISQIRYARLNYSARSEDRANGEITETGDEARRRRVGQVNDKRGENRSSWIRRGRNVYMDSKSGAVLVR